MTFGWQRQHFDGYNRSNILITPTFLNTPLHNQFTKSVVLDCSKMYYAKFPLVTSMISLVLGDCNRSKHPKNSSLLYIISGSFTVPRCPCFGQKRITYFPFTAPLYFRTHLMTFWNVNAQVYTYIHVQRKKTIRVFNEFHTNKWNKNKK